MRKSRLSQYKQERLLELFIAGSTARVAGELVGVHRNTVAYYFHRLRVLIAEHVDKHSWVDGEIELDESYFGGRRKGQRGRGAAGEVKTYKNGFQKAGGGHYLRDQNVKVDTWTVAPDVNGVSKGYISARDPATG